MSATATEGVTQQTLRNARQTVATRKPATGALWGEIMLLSRRETLRHLRAASQGESVTVMSMQRFQPGSGIQRLKHGGFTFCDGASWRNCKQFKRPLLALPDEGRRLWAAVGGSWRAWAAPRAPQLFKGRIPRAKWRTFPPSRAAVGGPIELRWTRDALQVRRLSGGAEGPLSPSPRRPEEQRRGTDPMRPTAGGGPEEERGTERRAGTPKWNER
ncbi:hypothetical protein NDU88_001530 [Pleurodeles waltl]|uniref:Uncharacterized protein n=1 Tax=Pleurodeles waltl TaxID=8319 RepID=A0AAV7VZH6_PLEWA|nr:hypothetical protein NDU88_001530 [Pleurodeles waltl]